MHCDAIAARSPKTCPAHTSIRTHQRNGWLIDDDAFNGDFDIDPHLANQLLDALVTSGQCSASDWTHDFADRGHSGESGTLARLYEEAATTCWARAASSGTSTRGSAQPMQPTRYLCKETSPRARRR